MQLMIEINDIAWHVFIWLTKSNPQRYIQDSLRHKVLSDFHKHTLPLTPCTVCLSLSAFIIPKLLPWAFARYRKAVASIWLIVNWEDTLVYEQQWITSCSDLRKQPAPSWAETHSIPFLQPRSESCFWFILSLKSCIYSNRITQLWAIKEVFFLTRYFRALWQTCAQSIVYYIYAQVYLCIECMQWILKTRGGN